MHFRVTTEHFHIANSYVYAIDKVENIVVFPWQQCLCKRAEMYRCMYMVYVVYFSVL